MATTLRQSDSATEIEIGKFLDKYFYPNHVTNFTRLNDVSHQMMGVDVQFNYKAHTGMLVDEKVAAHYVNKNIPTFAFEINFLLKSGQLVDGWFFDSDKSTQYYLLGWIWANKEKGFLASDITRIDIAIIPRTSIINMLSQHGITPKSASEIASEIRAKNVYGVYKRDYSKPYYFFYSPQLAEKPVNIIIKRDALLQLAIGTHTVTP